MSLLAAILLFGLCGLTNAVKPYAVKFSTNTDNVLLPDLLEISKTEVACGELKARGAPVLVVKKPTGGKLGFSHNRWLMVCECTGNEEKLVILWAKKRTDLVLVAGKPKATQGSAFVQPLAEPGSQSVTIPITFGIPPEPLSQSTLVVQFADVERAKLLVLQINYPLQKPALGLDFCLKSPTCYSFFESFVESEFSPENLLFLTTVDDSMDTLGAEQISYLWNNFIADGSPSTINIPAAVRTALSAAILGADGAVKAAYTAAELTAVKAALATSRGEIYSLLKSDTWTRYLGKPAFPVLSQ